MGESLSCTEVQVTGVRCAGLCWRAGVQVCKCEHCEAPLIASAIRGDRGDERLTEGVSVTGDAYGDGATGLPQASE